MDQRDLSHPGWSWRGDCDSGKCARGIHRALRRVLLLILAGAIMVLAAQPIQADPASEVEDQPAAAPAPAGRTLSSSAVPASRKATNLAIITIKGEINAITAISLKRRMQRAIEAGADGIVIELDTPGGEVGAVLDICSEIKRSPVSNVIAWVNPTAYSGGAIIALACKEIVLAPHATMGDAAPIAMNPIAFAQGLQDTERQKILAPLLSELVDSARLNGYDEKLVQAFLMLGVELWFIENIATGETYFIDENEYRALFGIEPNRGSPHVASGAPAGVGAPIPATSDSDSDDSSLTPPGGPDESTAFQPASPSLRPETIAEVSGALATPTTRPDFFQADPAQFRVIHYALDGNTLLTLKEADLKLYGFADTTIKNDTELTQYVGAANVRRLDQNWSESLVAFMTQGIRGLFIRVVLIVIFLIALFIELSMPGVGLPGTIALLALGGLVLPPLLVGGANWWAGVAVISGLGLVLLEIFVFPGFGVPGILGLLLMLAGLVGTFAGMDELFPGAASERTADLAWAISLVLLSLFIAGAGMFFFSRYTHRFPLAGRLVLADRQTAWGHESPSLLEAMNPAFGDEGPVKSGEIGITTTALRPSGSARFGEKLVDVVSEFGFLEQGTKVRVASVTKYRVGVEPVTSGGDTPSTSGADGAVA